LRQFALPMLLLMLRQLCDCKVGKIFR